LRRQRHIAEFRVELGKVCDQSIGLTLDAGLLCAEKLSLDGVKSGR
jgi:hypothetical protein